VEAFHTTFGKGVSEGIGASLIASGITGLTLYLYVKQSDTLQQRFEIFARAGLDRIFQYRSVHIREEYDRRLAGAKNIDIVGYGLSHFQQDFVGRFLQWSHQATVRVLLVDPDFPSKTNSFADQRDREENQRVGQIKSQVEEFELLISKLEGLNKDRFEVRRFRAIPSINLFRIDNEIFWGPYLMNQQSRNTPTLLVSRGGFLYDSLLAHFDALWAAASNQDASSARTLLQ